MKPSLKRVLEAHILTGQPYEVMPYSARGMRGVQTIALLIPASNRQHIIDEFDAVDATQEMLANMANPDFAVNPDDEQLRVDYFGKGDILVY